MPPVRLTTVAGQGLQEQRPAILVCDPARPSDAALYIVLLQWEEGALAYVRDFRSTRYATEGAGMQRL
jgi:RNA polymerase sigma-70 factor (ECF subfamily)